MKVTLILLVVVSVAVAQRGGTFSNWFRNRNNIFGGFRPLPSLFTPWNKVQPEVSNSIVEETHSEEEEHEEKHEEGGHGHGFSYDDTAAWAKDYPSCGGVRQSPIDLQMSDLVPLDEGSIKFINYWKLPKSMVLENNGHSIQLSGVWDKKDTPSITGAVLKNNIYELKQLHGHWGSDDNSGSEHTVDGKKFALEMHAVHWNTKYPSFEVAASKPDGLAVLGILYTASKEPNEMWETLIERMGEVEGAGAISVPIEPFPMNALHLGTPSSYATYPGSLTTPPCTESVTWLMSLKKHRISSEQLEIIRNVVKEEGKSGIESLDANFRETQDLNGRQVGLIA